MTQGHQDFICKCGRHQHHALNMCGKCYRAAHRALHRDRYRKYQRDFTYARGTKPMSENRTCSAFLGIHVAERVLAKTFKDVKIMPTGHPGYDFICNKGMKIDVKSATSVCTIANGISFPRWSFKIRRNKVADFFICIAFDNRDELNPQHAWMIPGHILNTMYSPCVSKSTVAKWDEYKIDLDSITACCDNMKNGDRA